MAAFEQLLEVKAVHQYLGVSAPTVSNWKRYLSEGKTVSLDKMEEMLLKFGARVKQEKVWEMSRIDGQMVSHNELVTRLTISTVNLLHKSGYNNVRCYNEGGNVFKVYLVAGDGQHISFSCFLSEAISAMEAGELANFLNTLVVIRN